MRRALILSVLPLLAAASLAAPPALANSGKADKKAPVTYFALQPLTATTIRREQPATTTAAAADVRVAGSKNASHAPSRPE